MKMKVTISTIENNDIFRIINCGDKVGNDTNMSLYNCIAMNFRIDPLILKKCAYTHLEVLYLSCDSGIERLIPEGNMYENVKHLISYRNQDKSGDSAILYAIADIYKCRVMLIKYKKKCNQIDIFEPTKQYTSQVSLFLRDNYYYLII